MFPYPSGAGLHVGHPRGYIATDVIARFKQLEGYGVLHPMGWDAFGLPAEQYALKNKLHPSVSVKKNISTFKKQLAKIGEDAANKPVETPSSHSVMTEPVGLFERAKHSATHLPFGVSARSAGVWRVRHNSVNFP